ARPKSGAILSGGQMPTDLADHGRIQFVLRDLNASMQAFRSVVRQDRYLALCDHIAVVNFFIHVMDGATGHLFPSDERLFPSVEPRKFRRDIEDRCIEYV